MAKPLNVQFQMDSSDAERHREKRKELRMSLYDYWVGAAEKVYFDD